MATNGDGAEKSVMVLSVKPQLVFAASTASDAINFYKAAFGAEELKRDMHPKRKADQEFPVILSAHLKLGSTVFLVSDHSDDDSIVAPPVKGVVSGCVFCLETDDVDGLVAKAVKAGGVVVDDGGEVTKEGMADCCGGKVGKITDPYGYVWVICSVGATGDVEVKKVEGGDVEA
ncbi:hypothetical protein GIB67_002742 [Kingdonia uniflora]|uniref:VOC domain-containing protein n=1 Tax=Kingdonia uniflora TaxID=39325 RepID=A0A7J7N434_9MAGN|nr:hypothetical protein GIB67_002742 [Kingdonia uniflora]